VPDIKKFLEQFGERVPTAILQELDRMEKALKV
jgi:GTP-dependent phosphoenolpyruvate carboxykinase